MAPLPSHRTLAGVLESDARLAAWAMRHRQELELTRILRRHLPRPIAERTRVGDTREGVLELAVTAGAIAAALRQRAPQLRATLAREGFDFAEIRVRVRIGEIGALRTNAPRRQWDAADAAPLFALADRLGEGPLKAALARWSRRARGR